MERKCSDYKYYDTCTAYVTPPHHTVDYHTSAQMFKIINQGSMRKMNDKSCILCSLSPLYCLNLTTGLRLAWLTLSLRVRPHPHEWHKMYRTKIPLRDEIVSPFRHRDRPPSNIAWQLVELVAL